MSGKMSIWKMKFFPYTVQFQFNSRPKYKWRNLKIFEKIKNIFCSKSSLVKKFLK